MAIEVKVQGATEITPGFAAAAAQALVVQGGAVSIVHTLLKRI
jgi:hypothetical protein